MKSKNINSVNEIKKEIDVPDQVFLGLMKGTINGPLKVLPAKKADVSFMNDKIIIMKNNFLLVNKISYIKKKFKIFRDTNKETI